MNTTTATAREVSWSDVVDYARAVALTGWTEADIDRMTTVQLQCRVTGAWDANEREHYVGYRSIVAHRTRVRVTSK